MRRIPIAMALLAALPPAVALADEPVVRITGTARDQGVNLEVKMPDSEQRTISVSGSGKISAAPDVAEINVGILSQAPTAREAMAANTETMAAIHAALKERGVAAKDIQTTNVSVNPQYSQPPQPQPGQPQREFVPKIVGYQVTNTVQITAREIKKLGELLDATLQAGANQMNGIGFRIDEPEKLLDEARKEAMADARRKAELLAGEAGVVVGEPVSIQESGAAPPPPRPMPRHMMAFRAEAAQAVPIAEGEEELRVTVNVIYRLQSPK